MAHKHELMARLQAARQNSTKVVETEIQKAYGTGEMEQLVIPPTREEAESFTVTIPSSPEETLLEEKIPNTTPGGGEMEQAAEKDPSKESVKICYTTISVPKQYGQKAKLYATFLNINMVEFTCGALDTYILQLQEEGKLPRVNF